jgi:hypothetical protein
MDDEKLAMEEFFFGARPASAGAETPIAAVEPSQQALAQPTLEQMHPKVGVFDRNDVSVAVRNWFVNRNPMFTRLKWVPVERVDFLMYSHRYARPGEVEASAAFQRVHKSSRGRGLVTVGSGKQQYCQTFQFPVQVGGSAQTARAQVMPGGIQTPFDFNMTVQLQNMVDDIEASIYYGLAQRPSALGADAEITAKMGGLSRIIESNNVKAPENAGRYRFDDFKRDTLVAARSGGGEPDLLLVATNFMSGFATWGVPIHRVDAGETVFGTAINLCKSPELPGVTIVEAPLLRPYSALALTSKEVYVRNKRNPFWHLRPNRGDIMEGDWFFEGAIEVINESHHAVVSGIERFAA